MTETPARAHLIVLGSQWGDEGKAKVIDYLATGFDIIGRYQGGGNAGHTVVVDAQKIVFHLIPTGIIHPDKYAYLGNGMVIHPPSLAEEMTMLRQRGIVLENRLVISNRAHAIMPYHMLHEKLAEESRAASKIGTTLRGIGPAYEDKIARCGLIMADLLDESRFRRRLEAVLPMKNALLRSLYAAEPLTAEGIIELYRPAIEMIRGFVRDGAGWLNGMLAGGASLMCEGAQGTHLDIDHGTYPFVTSSNASAGGAVTGLGVGPNRFRHVLGVAKAYVTRVGGGPFPSEDLGPDGQAIRDRGREFGATTGRPRRCGWFDLPSIRYSARINGLTALAMTKLDVLTGFDTIKICHAYQNGQTRFEEFPEDPDLLQHCEPVYTEVPGWTESLIGVKRWQDLPDAAQHYLVLLEKLTGVEIPIISVGPERKQTLLREDGRFFNDFPQLRQQ